MNQSRIWLVVKPTVGLPLFLGTVLTISLLIHWAVLDHTTWMGAYWNGAARVAAAPVAPAPVGRVYFDPDQAERWVEGGDTLGAVAAYLKSHPAASASISGYHDPSGGAEHNLELAKARAIVVRDALVADGVAAERLVLDKPVESTGSADVAREGRRVEVTIRR